MKAPTSPHAPNLDEVRAWLQRMLAGLKFAEVIAAILTLLARMRDLNAELTARLAHLQRKRPRSETLKRVLDQLTLPLGDLTMTIPAPPPSSDSAESDALKGKRKRGKSGGRATLPDHLERIPTPNPLPWAARICPLCGSTMKTVGHSICETLDIIPARIVVIQRLDETVACPIDDTIVSAPPPPAIVERGKLSDTLIVEALCDKFIEHSPIERQCTRFARSGVDLAPQTLGRSVAAAIDLLEPIGKMLEDMTRSPGLLGTDATGIPVLDPASKDGIRSGTMWCWTNARWISFFYAPRGDSESVRRFLGDNLARSVQCDGTSVTTFLERSGGNRPGCWAHGRRRFVEAARAGDTIALEGLRIIARIFAIERASTLAGDSAEQRRDRRRSETMPVLDELRTWLDARRATIPPKTPLGAALGYLDRQWKRLLLFVDDGNIEATNNRRERELRRLVLGRKNWLFTWLDLGAERTARVLSIVATCIAHDINPRAYLHLVTRLLVRGWPDKNRRDLLPDRMLAAHPDLYVGDSPPLPSAEGVPLLGS